MKLEPGTSRLLDVKFQNLLQDYLYSIMELEGPKSGRTTVPWKRQDKELLR